MIFNMKLTKERKVIKSTAKAILLEDQQLSKLWELVEKGRVMGHQ